MKKEIENLKNEIEQLKKELALRPSKDEVASTIAEYVFNNVPMR